MCGVPGGAGRAGLAVRIKLSSQWSSVCAVSAFPKFGSSVHVGPLEMAHEPGFLVGGRTGDGAARTEEGAAGGREAEPVMGAERVDGPQHDAACAAAQPQKVGFSMQSLLQSQ